MNVLARKMELMDWLLHIEDESKIEKILTLKATMDIDIVAYDVRGYSITKEDYIDRVHEADERISKGNFTTVEDLEKEIDNW
jgi:hypothetical protein